MIVGEAQWKCHMTSSAYTCYYLKEGQLNITNFTYPSFSIVLETVINPLRSAIATRCSKETLTSEFTLYECIDIGYLLNTAAEQLIYMKTLSTVEREYHFKYHSNSWSNFLVKWLKSVVFASETGLVPWHLPEEVLHKHKTEFSSGVNTSVHRFLQSRDALYHGEQLNSIATVLSIIRTIALLLFIQVYVVLVYTKGYFSSLSVVNQFVLHGVCLFVFLAILVPIVSSVGMLMLRLAVVLAILAFVVSLIFGC